VGAESLIFDKDNSGQARFLLGGTVTELGCRLTDSFRPVRLCKIAVLWEVMDERGETPSRATSTRAVRCYLRVMAASADRLRPIRRTEFERMVELGMFIDEKVELLRGAIIEVSPHGPPHASALDRLAYHPALLPLVTSGRARIRGQMPFAATDDSEPEPDLALVPPGEYDQAHPSTAFLVVEVADSSTKIDRVKAEIYAEAAVPEYWVVDIQKGLIEVHTEVVSGTYTRMTPYRRGEKITLGAFPDVSVDVADVLG
jgi:Uma2 family endonuclease